MSTFDTRTTYLRRIIVDFRYMEAFLNLPDGFRIVGMEVDPSLNAYGLRVMCPEDPTFEVSVAQEVPEAIPSVRRYVDEPSGRVADLIYHPALGQAEPANPFVVAEAPIAEVVAAEPVSAASLGEPATAGTMAAIDADLEEARTGG